MREDNRMVCKKLVKSSTKSSFEQKNTPSCSLCSFLRPQFRYRKCLFAKCPYGKDAHIFRRAPLKKERTISSGQPGGEGGRHV